VTDSLLQIDDLHARVGTSEILQGVNLAAGREPLALIGRNGMGKTTLCRAILGLVPAHRGTVRLAGRRISGRWTHSIARRGIGYVPQGRRVFPSLTVHEHLRLVQRRRRHARWPLDRVYELFPRLDERRRNLGNQLSGGEQQMLAIARALMTEPRLLVMDEPSEGLAPSVVEHLTDVLRHLADEDMGLLLVEQNLAVATTVADRIAIMVRGAIAVEVGANEILADEDMRRRYLGVSTGGGA
jgi:branched-chain amino acid transport system ATP-binding protein